MALEAAGQVALRQADFERVFQFGRRRQRVLLALWAAPSSARQAQIGLVVSKRWAKRAVDRNTVKRILREVFRQEAPELPALDLVFRLRLPWSPDQRRILAQEAKGMLQGLKQ